MQTGGSTYYYVTNLQGDVVALLDASGSTVASYAYDPYGKILSAEGTMAETNPLRYRGYYYDTESGLYYLQSRYYDPATCRFINADTTDVVVIAAIGITDKNLFAYCENNPIQQKDSDGRFAHLIIGAAVGVFTQYICDFAQNVIEGKPLAEVFKPTSSWVDYGASALSGALAATGIGTVASIAANAAIGGGSYLANCGIKGEKANLIDFGLSTFNGALAGRIGGKGADGKRMLGAVKRSKEVLKTAVSPKKVGMYTEKIANYAQKAVKSAVRTAWAGSVGIGMNKGRQMLTRSTV